MLLLPLLLLRMTNDQQHAQVTVVVEACVRSRRLDAAARVFF
jgi:hypothetical protein